LIDRGAGRLSRQAKHKNILFTGVPGIGKSTIIEKIVQRINRSKTGFYTREMRVSGRRVGFSITTLDGERGTLAHIDIPGHMRVGRYGVNLPDIDLIAVPSMVPENDNTVVVVDEIGKMECFSELFRQTLIKVMDSTNTIVGSISLKGDAFISAVKKRPDTLLISVNKKNRDDLVEEFFARVTDGKSSSANRVA
jgi:nucleoside-triphosphatase